MQKPPEMEGEELQNMLFIHEFLNKLDFKGENISTRKKFLKI